MKLQAQSLEEAGYDVYQLFFNYINGLQILMVHDGKETTWSQEDNISYLYGVYMENYFYTILVKKYLKNHMEYKAVLSLLDKDIDMIHAYNFDTLSLGLKLKNTSSARSYTT